MLARSGSLPTSGDMERESAMNRPAREAVRLSFNMHRESRRSRPTRRPSARQSFSPRGDRHLHVGDLFATERPVPELHRGRYRRDLSASAAWLTVVLRERPVPDRQRASVPRPVDVVDEAARTESDHVRLVAEVSADVPHEDEWCGASLLHDCCRRCRSGCQRHGDGVCFTHRLCRPAADDEEQRQNEREKPQAD
jgi:hypothetical protein